MQKGAAQQRIICCSALAYMRVFACAADCAQRTARRRAIFGRHCAGIMDCIALVYFSRALRRGNITYAADAIRTVAVLAVALAAASGTADALADAARLLELSVALSQAARAARCVPRTFLRTTVLPAPRWSELYRNLRRTHDDLGFIHFLGVDMAVFDRLLRGFRSKVEVASRGRPRRLDACATLALTLHSLCGRTALTRGLEVAFGVGKSVLCRCVKGGMRVLLDVLKDDDLANIEWPSTVVRNRGAPALVHITLMSYNSFRLICTQEKCDELAAAVRAYRPLPHGYEHVNIIGFIDGTNYRILKPQDTELQRKYANSWKHIVCVSSIFVFLPDGTIAWANINNYGTSRRCEQRSNWHA